MTNEQPKPDGATGRDALLAVLERRRPARIPYGPNYWQWTTHALHHGLPADLAGCRDQLDVVRRLGLDVFSRNIYSPQETGWWGGLCDVVWTGVECAEVEHRDGADRVIERTYRTRRGTLSERLRYVWAESTLVQEKYLIDDPAAQRDALAELVHGRRWVFRPERYAAWRERIGADGFAIAGELHSPLKLLHVFLNPVETTFFLNDEPEFAAELLAVHEAAQLDLVGQMARAGVRVMMSMDNLDSMFHPPPYVERYSASFYEKAARCCHAHGSAFFIHACGRQRDNLARIAALGVDGLEGVAFPTLGDVELDEAMRLSGERLILTGGISAQEFVRLTSRAEIFAYVRELFQRLAPYAHRFVLSASCNTPYTARWEQLVAFRDAWREYAAL